MAPVTLQAADRDSAQLTAKWRHQRSRFVRASGSKGKTEGRVERGNRATEEGAVAYSLF